MSLRQSHGNAVPSPFHSRNFERRRCDSARQSLRRNCYPESAANNKKQFPGKEHVMIASQLPSIEQNVAAVVQKAEETLNGLLDKSGTILYSSCATLTRGKYYFLGLNPGGAEEGTNSIQKSLDHLGAQTENAYLDQAWCSHAACTRCIGQHRLQKNYAALFSALGENPHSICASNLIFKRSSDEKGSEYPELAKLCWPVHETILQIVQPRAIITFGVTNTFLFVAEKLGGGSIQYFNSGHGNWSCGSLVKEGTPVLIGLPHLSKYTIYNRPEVIETIRSLIE
jgi:hypothetical protein